MPVCIWQLRNWNVNICILLKSTFYHVILTSCFDFAPLMMSWDKQIIKRKDIQLLRFRFAALTNRKVFESVQQKGVWKWLLCESIINQYTFDNRKPKICYCDHILVVNLILKGKQSTFIMWKKHDIQYLYCNHAHNCVH